MTEANTAAGARQVRRRWRVDGWSAGAVAIAALVLMPIAAVVVMALTPSENIWPHLASTVLPRYLENTGILMVGVAALSAAMGAGAAWTVVMYRFPGRRWLEWALFLPLAVPAYVGAYALVDFLEYAGPVQTALRELFGWSSARDYWFPQIRSRGAAVLVLSASLYPYVYLLARAAFREQPGGAYEVARALGAGPVARFWRVGLPLARPAIAAATAIVMMETVSDFGTVEFFAVQTLTTGIFSAWLEAGNAGGAAQLACVILVLVLVLVVLERASRRRAKVHQGARGVRPVSPEALGPVRRWLAFGLCMVPFSLGFLLPVGVMAHHGLGPKADWLDPRLLESLGNTLVVGGVAAVLTVGAGLFMVYGVRLSGHALPRALLPVTTLGYAAPGAVLGVGVLLPLAALDHRVADGVLALTGWDPGLVLTGSSAALVFAYMVRFFAIGQGAADAAFGRISPNIPLAARSLGRTRRGVLGAVYLPLMRASVGTALLLVFVDCVKELPATLLLRPFNYSTLAVRVYEEASLEHLPQAAPAALMICATGLAAVALLARANR